MADSIAPTQAGPRKTMDAVPMDAPWRWLAKGWSDMASAPFASVGYGVLVIGVSAAIIWLLWATNNVPYIPVAFGVFALAGPLLATGLYEISRRREAGEPSTIASTLFVKTKSPMQIAYIGFFVMFGALVWVRVAMLLYALFTHGNIMPWREFAAFAIGTPSGLFMLAVGTLAGGVIALGIYLCTVVSIPMLMNEKTDLFSAIATGLKAFNRSPGPMLLWAWLIAIVTMAGIASFFVGLAIAFPLLGHASWHAYREIRSLEQAA